MKIFYKHCGDGTVRFWIEEMASYGKFEIVDCDDWDGFFTVAKKLGHEIEFIKRIDITDEMIDG